MARPSTYSICACDLERGEWGVAVQSKFLAVGPVVAWAEAGVGAIATQAYANPTFGPDGLALLRKGQPAKQVLEQLIDADENSWDRQLGVEDAGTIYFAGDTCVFGDMALIGRIYEPDVAVLPIGDHFTMGPKEAAVAAELLGVKRMVPCHWGTFGLLTGTPDACRMLMSDCEVVALEPGGTTEV